MRYKSRELEALKIFFNKTDDDFKVGVKNINVWVDLWTKNEDDNSLYEKEDYIYDAWECFKVYSKNYVKLTTSFLQQHKFDSLIDYGAGLGLTTKLLAESFPDKQIYYHNLKGRQWDFSADYLKEVSNVKMIEDLNSLSEIDVLCAWEFFEHIKNPCSILDDILLQKPKILSIANSFGAVAYGHYSFYDNGSSPINRSDMSKIFNKHLKLRGFVIDPFCLKFWNRRPTIWSKSDIW
jgi:hypothetical protein